MLANLDLLMFWVVGTGVPDGPFGIKVTFIPMGGTPSPLRPLASRVESYRLRYSALLSRALAPSLRKNITP